MKVVMVSKALISAEYRKKLVELARIGVDIHAVVPSEWREAGVAQVFEQQADVCFGMELARMRFNGRFHLHYYPQLSSILRRFRPDLLHMDEEPFNFATYHGIRSASALNIPSIFFSWQNIRRRYPPPFSLMERSNYRCAAYAIAGSEEAAGVLRAKGYTGALSVVPQFGIDPVTFSPEPAPKRPFTIGFPNRLIEGKAPLLALAALCLQPADTKLVMAGDGPLRGRVEREIGALGLANRVTVGSRLPSSDVPNLLRSFDVVILPSVTQPNWKEQFGRVLMEAMACGIPVIGSDSGEIPAVIGDAGLLFPEGDVSALAAALDRVRADPALRRQMCVAGRRRVIQLFSHAVIAERTLQSYRAALR